MGINDGGLLRFDGEPVFRAIPEEKGIERAINTPFPVFRLEGKEAAYLSGGGDLWYAAEDPLGPWAWTTKVPKKIAALAAERPPEPEEEAGGDDDAPPPAVVVATEPTELIVTEGPPRWVPVAGEALLYCDNTDADVFLEISTQSYYLLLSGRWYRGVAVVISAAISSCGSRKRVLSKYLA